MDRFKILNSNKSEVLPPMSKRPQFDPNNVIVVVEDNIMNQQVIKTFFHMIKQKIYLVDNGEEAIKIVNHLVAEENSPSLILMDLHMPKMDGFETAKSINDNHQNKNIPIIAVSADAFTEQRQIALDAGFQDYVAKPIDFDQLTSVLMNYLPLIPQSS